ncbi:MAG: DUF4115 domain-containing protein [Candidatus Omnitrophica bacterium]|nr:DUF4115 domain-containing protein [Candidatus Omnitrophota bacterium]
MSIGERLKSAREAKGLTLDQAHKITKVQTDLILAIEEDRLEDLPDPAYAKIFLKKYANFLGLDGSALVQEYLALHGPLPPRPLAPVAHDEPKEVVLPRYLGPAAALAAAVIGIAFLAYLAFDLLGNPKSPRAPERPKARVVEPAAPAKLLVPRGQPLKLTIVSKADVWMQVKSDGAVIFQNVLAKGARESWTAKEELELWTGNAGAMELVLNGKSLGSPGTGVKKGIKVTHEGVK